jgi:hypothetical protein
MVVEKMMPAFDRLVDKAKKWITNAENQKKIMDLVKQAGELLTDGFNLMKTALEGLNTITGSTKNSIKVLLGVFLLFKATKYISAIGAAATAITNIGTQAKWSTKQAKLLRGALVLAASVEVAKHSPEIKKAIRGEGGFTIPVIGKHITASAAKNAFAAGAAAFPGLGFVKTALDVEEKVKPGGIRINGDVHVHGVQNVPELETQLTKRNAARAHTRRGERY